MKATIILDFRFMESSWFAKFEENKLLKGTFCKS